MLFGPFYIGVLKIWNDATDLITVYLEMSEKYRYYFYNSWDHEDNIYFTTRFRRIRDRRM